MCEQILNVNFTTQGYSANTQVRTVDNCNGFTVKNRGNNTVQINGDPLGPGESKAFMLNKGEVYLGRINVTFHDLVPAVVPRVLSAFVTQKFYMQDTVMIQKTDVKI
jgi:hypothetical protein